MIFFGGDFNSRITAKKTKTSTGICTKFLTFICKRETHLNASLLWLLVIFYAFLKIVYNFPDRKVKGLIYLTLILFKICTKKYDNSL